MKTRYIITLAISVLLTGGATARAADPFYALILHGFSLTNAQYDKGVLTVNFRHSRNAAGNCLHYRDLGAGNAGWVDRPLNRDEPFVLKQAVKPAIAEQIINELHGSGYWKFFCRNTRTGFIEVSRSEKTGECATF